MATKVTRTSRSRPALVSSSLPQPTRRKTAMPSHELENAETSISRPPSPQREEMPSRALENAEITISRPPLQQREKVVPTPDENRASTDVEDSEDESEDDDPRWATVKRGRAHSLDSARKNLRNKKFIYLKSKTLSTEQEKIVEAAASLMTQEQKDQVQRRQDKVTTRQENNLPEPGPSRSKGKAVDPREWGNAGIEPEELDINVQEAMIKAYERGRKEAEEDARRPKNEDENVSKDKKGFQVPLVSRYQSIASFSNAPNLETRRAGSRPATQLVPNSSLGTALGRIAQMVEDPGDPDDHYDTSSEYDSSIYS